MACLVFFFNDTATTEIYTLSLHDALPISAARRALPQEPFVAALVQLRLDLLHRLQTHSHHDEHRGPAEREVLVLPLLRDGDRKSTRLNSSHANISYAVFCLKKKIPSRYVYQGQAD